MKLLLGAALIAAVCAYTYGQGVQYAEDFDPENQKYLDQREFETRNKQRCKVCPVAQMPKQNCKFGYRPVMMTMKKGGCSCVERYRCCTECQKIKPKDWKKCKPGKQFPKLNTDCCNCNEVLCKPCPIIILGKPGLNYVKTPIKPKKIKKVKGTKPAPNNPKKPNKVSKPRDPFKPKPKPVSLRPVVKIIRGPPKKPGKKGPIKKVILKKKPTLDVKIRDPVTIYKILIGTGPKPTWLGKPKPKCKCPKILKPVCDKKGNRYPNACVMKCKKPNQKPMKCTIAQRCWKKCKPTKYTPYCGTDKKTYYNKCAAQIAKCIKGKLGKPITFKKGECKGADKPTVKPKPPSKKPPRKPCICPKIYKPVCDKKGNRYSNKCVMKCRKPGQKPMRCTPKQLCFKKCRPNKYKPLCGNDKKTYYNLCAFQRAKCLKKLGKPLKFKPGECTGKDAPTKKPKKPSNKPPKAEKPCDQIHKCKPNYKPVCDKKGKNHYNICFFKRLRCKLRRIGGNPKLAKSGLCNKGDKKPKLPRPTRPTKPCYEKCKPKRKHVCANGKKLFFNGCFYRIAKCKAAKKGKWVVRTPGKCKKSPKPKLPPPPKPIKPCYEKCKPKKKVVCANKKKMYNACFARIKACKAAKKGKWVVRTPGKCKKQPDPKRPPPPKPPGKCTRKCSNKKKPVCDSKKKSHYNGCAFAIKQCQAAKKGKWLNAKPGLCKPGDKPKNPNKKPPTGPPSNKDFDFPKSVKIIAHDCKKKPKDKKVIANVKLNFKEGKFNKVRAIKIPIMSRLTQRCIKFVFTPKKDPKKNPGRKTRIGSVKLFKVVKTIHTPGPHKKFFSCDNPCDRPKKTHDSDTKCPMFKCVRKKKPDYPNPPCDLKCHLKETVTDKCGFHKKVCRCKNPPLCKPKKPKSKKCHSIKKVPLNVYGCKKGNKKKCQQCHTWKYELNPIKNYPKKCKKCEVPKVVQGKCGSFKTICKCKKPVNCTPKKPKVPKCHTLKKVKSKNTFKCRKNKKGCKPCFHWRFKPIKYNPKEVKCDNRCQFKRPVSQECGSSEKCVCISKAKKFCRPQRPPRDACFKSVKKYLKASFMCGKKAGKKNKKCVKCFTWIFKKKPCPKKKRKCDPLCQTPIKVHTGCDCYVHKCKPTRIPNCRPRKPEKDVCYTKAKRKYIKGAFTYDKMTRTCRQCFRWVRKRKNIPDKNLCHLKNLPPKCYSEWSKKGECGELITKCRRNEETCKELYTPRKGACPIGLKRVLLKSSCGNPRHACVNCKKVAKGMIPKAYPKKCYNRKKIKILGACKVVHYVKKECDWSGLTTSGCPIRGQKRIVFEDACGCPRLKCAGCDKNLKLDLFYLLDSSGSVPKSDWQDMMSFFREVLFPLHLRKGMKNRIAISKFGKKYKSLLKWGDKFKPADLLKNKYRYKSMGATWTDRALRETYEYVKKYKRRGAKQVCVVVTDGRPNGPGRKKVKFWAKKLAKHCHVAAFGVGRRISQKGLNQISEKFAKKVKHVTQLKRYFKKYLLPFVCAP